MSAPSFACTRIAPLVALLACELFVCAAHAQDPRPLRAQKAPQVDAWRERAETRAARGDREGAIAAYAEALRIAPDDGPIRGARGALLLELGRFELARKDLERAVALEPSVAEHRVSLGDACRALHDRACAAEAYLSVLAERPDARAAAGYDALGHDAFARPYDARPDLADADASYASERSGFAGALGAGLQTAGIGIQLGYYHSLVPGAIMITPFLAYGMTGFPSGAASAFAHGPAAGVMALFGPENRWVVSVSAGLFGVASLRPYEKVIAERGVYAIGLELGREWMWHGGVFVRSLFGGALVIDPYYDLSPSFVGTLALGWKP